jgi:MFS family permease
LTSSNQPPRAGGEETYPLQLQRFTALGLYWFGSLVFWASWFMQAPILDSYWVEVRKVALGNAEYLLSGVGLAGIVTALFAGFALDRLGPHRAVMVFLALIMVGFGLRPLAAYDFPYMILLTVVAGAGGVALQVSAAAVVAQWFGRHRMTWALSIALASFFAGQAVGLLVGAPLVNHLGIVWALAVFSFALVAATVAWAVLVPNGPREPAGPPPPKRPTLRVGLPEVLRAQGSWLFFGMALLFGGVAVYTPSLLPGLLSDSYELSAAHGGQSSTVFPIGSVVGLFVLGYIARRKHQERRFGVGTALALLIFWLAFTVSWSAADLPFAATLVVIGLFGFVFQPCFTFAIESLERTPGIGPGAVGIASGFFFTGVGIGGYVFPTALATFVEVNGYEAGVVGILVLAALLITLWLIVSLFKSPRGGARPVDLAPTDRGEPEE